MVKAPADAPGRECRTREIHGRTGNDASYVRTLPQGRWGPHDLPDAGAATPSAPPRQKETAMRAWLAFIGLVAGTFAAWGLALWLFGEIGLLLIVLSGFTMPIWAMCLLEALGIDDRPAGIREDNDGPVHR